MDLSDLISRNAAFAPDKAAIRFDGSVLTYAGFADRIAALACGLKSQLGIGRGDRVAILSTNCPDYLVVLYACARLGAMMVPINWRLAVPEQIYILADASVKALFVEESFAAVVAPLAEALPEARAVGIDYAPGGLSLDILAAEGTGDGSNPHVDYSSPLLIVYTSGTTGRPKGAVLRQEALLWNGVMVQHVFNMTSEDHILTVLPFFHVGGLNVQTTPALHLGATVTLHARFTAEATLASFTRDKPSLTVLVPATIQAVIDHPAWRDTDISSLRAIGTGSTHVPQDLMDAFTMRGVPVLQIYGATETSPTAIYTRLGGDLSRPGCIGLPGIACEARIVDRTGAEVPHGIAGEIVVRGPNVLFEYWGNEEATRQALRNGWYHTGDVGTRDIDGYFYIHDRVKNLIISGGENIYPAEIERVLCAHRDVADAAVVGCTDPKWQEVPVAFVVCRTGVAPDLDGLNQHLAQQLARYKLPREIIFVETLPRNVMGKVQHFVLKERLSLAT